MTIPFKICLLLLVALSIPSATACAQFHEDFESPTSSWQRNESDCVISETNWVQRRANEVEPPNRFERIFFRNGPGTQIYVSHDVTPAFVIPELTPSVRIKSTRSGMQLMVRIVFPHTPSPTGEGPMTTTLGGPRYRGKGRWETLSFAQNEFDLQQQLKEKVWLLRRKHGAHVSHRDAYVDKIVLNLYAGAGETTVEIDDLKLNGIVSAENLAAQTAKTLIVRDPAVNASGFNQEPDKHQSLVVRDGSVLLVKNKPFFPRIVEHNGEPLDYLQALGFNTIELKTVATEPQLRQAQQLGLWLISPPPASVGIRPIEFQFDRVLAWKIGDRLTSDDLLKMQQQVREIRESDQRVGRPVLGHLESDWSQISQLTDIISLGVEPIGTSFLASQYSDWILARREAVGSSKPIWADIQTELSESLVSQIRTLAKSVPPVPIEPQQIKFLIYEAIAGGARGLRFRSRSRLDGADPLTRLRAQTLQWANAEMDLIEPWAVGGAMMGELNTGQPQLEVTAINTNRSRLLLIQRPTHHEQYLAGDVQLQTVAFEDSVSNSTDLPYLVGDAGLIPLPNSKSIAGKKVVIENCPYVAAVVLTQDPMVIKSLRQSLERAGKPSIVQLHQQLTQHWLAIMQLIDTQMGRMGRSSMLASAALNEAVNSFRMAQRLLSDNSPQEAMDYLKRADERLSFMRREIITEPLGGFQSKTSTPFGVHCSLISLHWELASRLSTVDWNPNGLAGGDFENLEHMMSNGWANLRLEDETLSTRVELADTDMVDGSYALKMTVNERTAGIGLVEATPLWISTPAIPVRGGQLVRIHGWAKVPEVIRGSHDGLTITDSIGGADLMERIPVTQGWQEFTLYRGVPNNRTVQVTFALTGLGVAMLDEVTIRTVDLPPPTQRQARKESPGRQ